MADDRFGDVRFFKGIDDLGRNALVNPLAGSPERGYEVQAVFSRNDQQVLAAHGNHVYYFNRGGVREALQAPDSVKARFPAVTEGRIGERGAIRREHGVTGTGDL